MLQRILQKWIKQERKVLGRWSIDSCDKKTNNKVDMSNEDHCGPCGQYILEKTSVSTCKNKEITDINAKSKSILYFHKTGEKV
jgi:hypothetical protein